MCKSVYSTEFRFCCASITRSCRDMLRAMCRLAFAITPRRGTKRICGANFPRRKWDPQLQAVREWRVMGALHVAYNKKSDFDYWCASINEMVSSQQLKNQGKGRCDSRWVPREIGVPVHLFVNDVESVKQIFREDEEEAFGSTVGAVLKDEFSEAQRDCGKLFCGCCRSLCAIRNIRVLYGVGRSRRRQPYVDLASLRNIADDFLGAALFQIIK